MGESPRTSLKDAPSDDPVDQRNAWVVQFFCVASLGLATLAEALRLSRGAPLWRFDFVFATSWNFVLVVASALALRLARRGGPRPAVALLCWTIVSQFTLSLCIRGAHGSLDVLRSFPAILAIVALMLGRRSLLAMFGVFAMGLGVGELRDVGMLGPPLTPPAPPALGTVGQTVSGLVVLVFILDRFGGSLRDTLTAALERGRALEQTAAQLANEIEQKSRAQAALVRAQKLEVVGRLSAGVAHDLNNLLTVMQGGVDLARGALPDGHAARRDLESIGDAVSSAARLTRQLLTFARRQATSPQPVLVDDVLGRFVPLLQRIVGSTVRVTTSFGAGAHYTRIDPAQVEQLLLNLAANARDAMPDGGTLRISTAASLSANGRQVSLRVTDDGTGMDEATRARIFEPFFTTKEVGRGTGIGMATCLEIVTQAGGHIEVESAPGKGTTVSVFLPEMETKSTAAAPAHPSEQAGPD